VLVGQVLYGSNNIYTVQLGTRRVRCRIKGKILRTEQRVYNPIAVGDLVEVRCDALGADEGWIVARRERNSSLARWNKKRRALQVIAANADTLVCVGSSQFPPFRPRFLDRLLVSAEAGNLAALILLNKCDLDLDRETRARLQAYRKAGYAVLLCSAKTGEGLGQLAKRLRGKTSIFCGQSGVGKSSILNELDPAFALKVGEVSSKHERGTHITSYAILLFAAGGLRLIDTPGIRELEVGGIPARELHFHYREFRRYAPECAFDACLHIDEPRCAVQAAVQAGKIHPDRWESYLRLYEELAALEKDFHGSPYD